LKLFLLIPIILLILFIRFCIIIVKKQWIEKKSVSSGDQIAGQAVFKQFQNKDKQSAIEHIRYMEEDETEQKLQDEPN